VNSNAGRIAKKLARRNRRMETRPQVARQTRFERMMSGAPPVLSTTGLKDELAEKTQATVYVGVPLMLRVGRVERLTDTAARREIARPKSRDPVRTPRPTE
jgi:hypothetical protein